MIPYLLNRCKIAVLEKKLWFLYAGIGVIIYLLFILVFPANYVISSSVNFNIADSDKAIGIPGGSVWRQISRLVGSEQSFLATQMNNMPAELHENITKKYINEVKKNPSQSNTADQVIRHRPQTMVLRFLSLSVDNANKKYVITYKGEDRSMGIDLISYFTSRLVDHLYNTVYNRLESQKLHKTAAGAGKLKERADVSPIPERAQLSDDELKIYKFLLEKFSTFKNTEPQITSENGYSLAGFAGDFFLALFISLFVILLVIIGSEFSGKHLTSEVQVARYLNTHIVGTLREIKSISSKE